MKAKKQSPVTIVTNGFTKSVKGTQTAPIMLGPVFLHWDGLYPTYCDFLSKIRSALGYRIPVEKLVFGTDEALALVNAIKTNFPSSQHILCTRHLKANAQRKFLNHNVPEEIRKRIISAIFDKTGLIYSNSHISYFERESKVWKISGMLGANISKINCSIH